MNLKSLQDQDLAGKKVLVRLDMDVPLEDGKIVDDSRLLAGLPTIQKVLEKNALKVILIGHMGRPENHEEELSTKQLLGWYKDKLGQEISFATDFDQIEDGKVILFENLRFWLGEKANDGEFAKKLASLADFYVNEAFAVSHRESASIVGVPKHLPSAFGLQFVSEVENLSKLLEEPARPFIVLLSGVKEDKLDYFDRFRELSDKVLVGGRLPLYLDEDYKDPKAIVARLIQDKEDITLHSVEAFEDEIARAKTILVSGPLGHFEEEGHRQGTERIFSAVADNENAFKVAGGGDTANALNLLGLADKFDWVSTGGGAMLDYLANGSLPGIEALR